MSTERKLKRVLDQMEAIENEARDRALALLRVEVQKAFDAAVKRRPHWERIIFGNGAFTIRGMTDDEYFRETWSSPTYVANISGNSYGQKWQGPMWLRHLWGLCELAEGQLDDVYPTVKES